VRSCCKLLMFKTSLSFMPVSICGPL
jgi:hypothetical protein